MLQVSYSRGAYVANVGCNGVKGPANKATFDYDGKKVTVQQYFESKYKMKLKYPHLPCVWVGSRDKMNLIPMEVKISFSSNKPSERSLSFTKFLYISITPYPSSKRKRLTLVSFKFAKICSIAAGQEYRRKLNDIQTSNMIKVAATPADLRKQKILNSVKDMKFSQDSYAKSFGISVDSNMTEVVGKFYGPFFISYHR